MMDVIRIQKVGAYLQQTMEITSTTDDNDIIKKLKARGGRDQLLMFLTGPVGLGKSTAMKMLHSNFVMSFYSSGYNVE